MNKVDKLFLEELSSINSQKDKIIFFLKTRQPSNLKKSIEQSKYTFSLEEIRKLSELTSDDILQECWHIINGNNEIPNCPICNSPKKFNNIKAGYSSTCGNKKCQNMHTKLQREKSMMKKFGVKNPSELKSVQEKRKQTNLRKYGVENPYQRESVKDKIKKTNLERYGVENVNNNPDIVAKRVESFKENIDQFKASFKKTCNEKYGTDYPWQTKEIRDKVQKIFDEKYNGHPLKNKEYMDKLKATNLERYGVEHLIQDKEWCKERMLDKYGVEHQMELEETKRKIEETCIEKYGTRHPMQNQEVFNRTMKAAYKLKDYEMPSGRIVKVQGYEPAALDELFKKGYKEEDIIVDSKEIESYIGSVIYNTNNGKTHRYYPDIYIVSENKIIEVKSEYTYKKNKDINLLKMKAVLDKSINFEFRIL